MHKIFVACIVFAFLMALTGCPTAQVNKEAAWRAEILKTDSAFSKASSLHGMKKAFIEYIDNNGILLRPGHLPIIGADAIDYLTQTNDSSITLTWHPAEAQVSSAGDLGYSYGIYNLQLQDSSFRGTYVSIWKKQKDGKWKFILDSGNEGIGK